MSPEVISEVKFNSENELGLLVLTDDVLFITWSPTSVQPPMEVDSFTVDIRLVGLSSLPNYLLLAILAENVTNSGQVFVMVPPNLIPAFEGQPVGILVAVSDSVSNELQAGAGIWSLVGYLVTTLDLRSNCRVFINSQPPDVGQTLLQAVQSDSPCPPLREQAQLPNSGLQVEAVSTVQTQFFHPGTAICYQQVALIPP